MPISVDAAGGLLRFASISQGDGGRYVCEAGNEAGTARATAEVIVQGTENSVLLLRVRVPKIQLSFLILYCK